MITQDTFKRALYNNIPDEMKKYKRQRLIHRLYLAAYWVVCFAFIVSIYFILK